jgi:Protein of unknown function (DUF1592)/Protein of unknown function (DUF1588)/Protein of unknown function (DUF1587)/Protein of unknown function (DUF1595)/Protein of unknown function (DUF1585)/Planctomycete cytochrome C
MTFSRSTILITVAMLIGLTPLSYGIAAGPDAPATEPPYAGAEAEIHERFDEQIQPLLTEFCLRCHNAEKMKSGVRVDSLDGALDDRQLALLGRVREMVSDEAMPPEDEPQPTPEQRRLLDDWIDSALAVARSHARETNGSIRRLSVAQYRNTLRDLLGLEEDLTDTLPADGVSRDGFVNNGENVVLSPRLIESYFDIAEKALDLCIVDEDSKPKIQDFRMDLGEAINTEPCPDDLILGANSKLLRNEDFMVTQLTASKPFDFEPFFMRTKYRFIEGYQGNDTVRGWREYDSIYHAVFACVRGTDGYPKGEAYETVPAGLLLRPAIPSPEVFGVASTYGPNANFKISLRELPEHGRFRVTVTTARYDDGLLLDPGDAAQTGPAEGAVVASDLAEPQTVRIEEPGIYQVDAYAAPAAQNQDPAPQRLSLQLGERRFSGTLNSPAFLVVRLPAGPLTVTAQYGGSAPLERVAFTPLDNSQDVRRRFERFERRAPHLGVHLGFRRDCGSTLAPVGAPQTVSSPELSEFVFEGAINNFPNPEVEADNVNYLAGVREIGVRSEYTDGRDMPRLLIRSVEFEGPLYEMWPPATHRNIFIESPHKDDPPLYARDIVQSFASRAYRRPVTDDELASLLGVWQDSFAATGDFQQSVRDALLVVLTSPQFLFLIEKSETPEPEAVGPYELASKLSYFLWNTAPDDRLLQLAATGALRESLDGEITRMIADPRFEQFVGEFAPQWLNLDRFDVVAVDRERYPKLTRDTRSQLRREPAEFLQYLIRQDLPLRNLIESDFIVANEVVAAYYGLGDRTESGFEFVAIPHGDEHLGGLLTEAAILSGLSDGREPNPVKRGAWLARKIIAEPPDDPPPNVPALAEDDRQQLTLRERLERHRSQDVCANCHGGIDPWGLPLEQFDAGGLFRTGQDVDARSVLPDQTEVADANGLKAYLAEDRIDQVAFSVLKHLATYAIGRPLTYSELELLREQAPELKSDGYRMQELLRFVVKSDLFLEK